MSLAQLRYSMYIAAASKVVVLPRSLLSFVIGKPIGNSPAESSSRKTPILLADKEQTYLLAK